MKHGKVTVIMGPMYSGKSTRLLEQVRRADLGRKRFKLFKPAIDNRYSAAHVVSHDGRSFPCDTVDPNHTILPLVVDGVDVVFVDEAQFFSPALIEDADTLAKHGIDVVIAGLDLDFRGIPFQTMVELAFAAEEIVKLTAICDLCGTDASRSQRVVDGHPETSGEIIQVGGLEEYEARCRACFIQAECSTMNLELVEEKETCELSG